jgi:hypothetical protein
MPLTLTLSQWGREIVSSPLRGMHGFLALQGYCLHPRPLREGMKEMGSDRAGCLRYFVLFAFSDQASQNW